MFTFAYDYCKNYTFSLCSITSTTTRSIGYMDNKKTA